MVQDEVTCNPCTVLRAVFLPVTSVLVSFSPVMDNQCLPNCESQVSISQEGGGGSAGGGDRFQLRHVENVISSHEQD